MGLGGLIPHLPRQRVSGHISDRDLRAAQRRASQGGLEMVCLGRRPRGQLLFTENLVKLLSSLNHGRA